jgi:hypothetical protein
MPFTDVLGIAGALLVFASFWMKSTVRLRLVALASNVVFIAYALAAALPPILILHCALLPLNAVRLWDLLTLRRHAQAVPAPQPARRPVGFAMQPARPLASAGKIPQ